MRKLIFIIILLLSFVFNSVALCDGLIVYGDDFSFAVSEPQNWFGDTDNAYRMGANIIFYTKPLSSDSTFIKIRVNTKVDENTSEDLLYDMNLYKEEYPTIQFKDISVLHPEYNVFPKLFFIPNNFYEYVAYLNPGKNVGYVFSVSMSIAKREATEDELVAYQNVINSLKYLTENVVIKN